MSTSDFGQPQYQPQYIYTQAPPEPRNGLGIASISLGIVGLLFCLMPITGFIGFALGAIGLILGLSALGRLKRGKATNTKTTWAGIITSLAAIVFGIIGIVMFFTAVDQLGDDLDEVGNNWNEYSDCIGNASTPEEMNAC